VHLEESMAESESLTKSLELADEADPLDLEAVRQVGVSQLFAVASALCALDGGLTAA
jgi:hypothetical protein